MKRSWFSRHPLHRHWSSPWQPAQIRYNENRKGAVLQWSASFSGNHSTKVNDRSSWGTVRRSLLFAVRIMLCPWFVPKDIPWDHPRYLYNADDDCSQKAQCWKNNIQNFHSGTPPSGFLCKPFKPSGEEQISKLPRTFLPEESLTTCNADSTFTAWKGGIFILAYFLTPHNQKHRRKHQVFLHFAGLLPSVPYCCISLWQRPC